MGDLFCGRGGATKGFQAHGWECWGIDLYPQPLYPGRFIQADIAQLIELPYADFYWCSSPCEQFSIFQMKMFHKSPKYPFFGLNLFQYAKYLLENTGKPYIMENVRAAQDFVGRSTNHCGPFHMWGNSVPAIFPAELYKVKKGIDLGSGIKLKGMTQEEKRLYRKQFPNMQVSGISKERAEYTSKWAEIPQEIAEYISLSLQA